MSIFINYLIQIEMKNVLMFLVLLGGFAIQSADAQSCFTPCPPGCCISSCCLAGKSASASATPSLELPADVVFASLLVEGLKTDAHATKMSHKEKKACQAATTCQPTSACPVTPACKLTTPTTTEQHPTVYKASLLTKS